MPPPTVVLCPDGVDGATLLQQLRDHSGLELPDDTRTVGPQEAEQLLATSPGVRLIVPVPNGEDEHRARLQRRVAQLEDQLQRVQGRRAVQLALRVADDGGRTRDQARGLLRRARRRVLPGAGPVLHLHIGLPKTATTLLQYRVFKRQDELAYLHDPRDRDPGAVEELLKRYQQAAPDQLATLGARLHQALPDHDLLVSNENISMLTRDIWNGTGPTPTQLADRLGRLDRELRTVRVILGIRRQDQWLGSMYAQSGHVYPEFSQEDFDERLVGLCERPPVGVAGHLDYDRLHTALVDRLGADNVLVLPSELLAEDPGDAMRRLDAFLDLDVFARAYRDDELDLAPVNVRSEGRNRWQLKDRDESVTMSDELSARIVERFAPGNRRVAAAIGIDLGRYGYY